MFLLMGKFSRGIARRSQRHSGVDIPADLCARLEHARLDNLALMRALDRHHLADHLTEDPALRAFGELEADCAEAQQVILTPPSFGISWEQMVRDTEASLHALPLARERVRALLEPAEQEVLRSIESAIRGSLDQSDVFRMGRDGGGSSPPTYEELYAERVSLQAQKATLQAQRATLMSQLTAARLEKVELLSEAERVNAVAKSD